MNVALGGVMVVEADGRGQEDLWEHGGLRLESGPPGSGAEGGGRQPGQPPPD